MTTEPEPLDKIEVEVVYALPDRYWSLRLQLPTRATVADALAQAASALGDAGVQPDTERMAVYSRPVVAATTLRHGDRLELLRPLANDPKQSRRDRASSTPAKR